MARLLRPTALVLAVLVCAGAATAATPTTADVPALAKRHLRLMRTSAVPVLLPPELPLATRYRRLYIDAWGRRGTYGLAIDAARDCRGANACFVATFEGQRGGSIPGRPNARLAGGVRALYLPGGCGASCSPASLFFVRNGVLYTWQVKDLRGPRRSVLLEMASAALRDGAR
jgi:hypothetical protein